MLALDPMCHDAPASHDPGSRPGAWKARGIALANCKHLPLTAKWMAATIENAPHGLAKHLASSAHCMVLPELTDKGHFPMCAVSMCEIQHDEAHEQGMDNVRTQAGSRQSNNTQ